MVDGIRVPRSFYRHRLQTIQSPSVTPPLPDYAGVFAAMPLPATLIDAHGVIVDLNDAFLDLARRDGIPLRREDRIGHPIWEFAGQEDPQLGRRAILDFLAGGSPERWRRVEQNRSGRVGQHDMQLLALRDSGGTVCGALIARQEVTDAVEQARKLDESLQLLSAFRTVGQLVLASLDVEVILETIAREIVKAGIFRSLTLALVDERSHTVEVVQSYLHAVDPDGAVIPGSALRASSDVVGLSYDLDDDNIMAEVARTGELIVTDGDDPRFDQRVDIRIPRDRVCYFIPVKKGDRVLAVISTGSPPQQRDAVLQRIEAMGPLLDQAAIAIEHARLYRETRSREQDARIGLALGQVRTEILQMQTDEDWSRVVGALRRELRVLVDYGACGINLVAAQSMHSFSAGPGVRDEVRQRELPLPVAEALRTGQPCYRRTQEQMRASGDNPALLRAGIQSVVDAPFGTGTLAMNSTKPEAFDDGDIEILCQFAAVVAEGHRRLEDLQALAAKERQLQQAQKMEAVGRLTAGIAHNFNNMLQAITGNLDLALMEAPPDVRRLVDNALKTSYRAAQMVQQLMVYSRQSPQRARFESVDAVAVIRDVVTICQRTFDRRITFEVDEGDGLPAVLGNGMQLEQVLMNLCINSRDALEEVVVADPRIRIEGARVELSQECVPADASAGTYLRLRVRDNGPGMDDDTRRRIFEPFFTTKEVDKGTGLGLSTALGIVQEHGGWIECDSALGAGACFDLYLPAVEGVDTHQESSSVMEESQGSETILVIDDEEMVRQTTMQMLDRRGFKTLDAEDGEQGLEIFRQHRDGIDLVLLDQSMPRMSGLDTLRALRQMAPDLRIVIITGYPTRLEDFEGADDLLQKPFSLDELVGRVRKALDRAP